MSKLFFIGDSITTGAWDRQGGWANRLIGQIMQKTMKTNFEANSFYCMPYNLGISGDTAEGIISRFSSETALRVDPDNTGEAVEVVVAIGVNDSVYMVEEDRPRFTDDQFCKNLNKLADIVQGIEVHKISFIGLPPVDDDLLNPIPWAPEKAYACEHVKRFEDIISEICTKRDIAFLPLFERWKSMPDWKDYLIDGVHPNSKGHELMAEQIGDFLFTPEFEKFHTDCND